MEFHFATDIFNLTRAKKQYMEPDLVHFDHHQAVPLIDGKWFSESFL
ncbi:MAG: hypothetical protein ABI683_14410 [Ginsengibacter sp.]